MGDASTIAHGMEVLCSDGGYVGTVDHLAGDDAIKLKRKDPESLDGMHHLIPTAWVDAVEADTGKVRLNRTKLDVQTHWKAV